MTHTPRILSCLTLLGAMAVLTTACDAIVDATYHGESLLNLQGEVHNAPASTDMSMGATATVAESSAGALQLAVLWANLQGGTGGGLATVAQQTMTTAVFPARYGMMLHTPPDAKLLAPEPDGTGRYALGLVVVYVDVDGNGHWSDPADELVGGAESHVIVYTPDGTTGPYIGQLAPGYHVLRRDTKAAACAKLSGMAVEAAGANVDLVIADALPPSVLFDLDCDGKGTEWRGACPAPAHLAMMCNKRAPAAWPCGACPH